MRKLAYNYLFVWPFLTVIFVLLVDVQSNLFRVKKLYEFSSNYQADMLRMAYGAVKESGTDVLHPNNSQAFKTLDIYLTDEDQEAITKPRFSKVGTTITNKSIIRALEMKPGEIETWLSPADYRGVPVVCAYTSIELDGKLCAMLCEVDRSEVFGFVERWWYYGDVVWMLVFSALGMTIVWYLRSDIVKVANPAKDSSQSGYTMLIKAVMQFPLSSSGLALVDESGVITHCSPAFARILGALMTREVIGTSIHNYSRDPDRHRQSFENFTTDLVEREVTCLDVEKKERDVFLSVSKLNGSFLVVLRKREGSGNAH